MDNIDVTNKTYNMKTTINNPLGPQSRQRLISITVLGSNVTVKTDKSTEVYPTPDPQFAQYYARHLRRHFTS